MLPMRTGLPAQALRLVPYLTSEEVNRLCAGCRGRQQDQDTLLILLLFQTGLRVSEALSLTVGHLSRQPGALEVLGKGGKLRLVACPAPLSHRLKAYAFDRGLGPDDRLFPVGRKQAWQIIVAVAANAGLGKRVYPQLFRHSGAIDRLRQTGNPRALQLHLGHASPLMTMRYLSTLTAEEALRINQGSASRTEPAAPPRPLTPLSIGQIVFGFLGPLTGCQHPFRQHFYIDSEHYFIDNGDLPPAVVPSFITQSV